ncbi:MAG TPA: MBL fold metallo-hydrolase [Candidatus Ozemobacteraceae bacterium]|nr:MBL fold metallo-hydrolase [Candidatus Ozemobacteraceae bacterium]
MKLGDLEISILSEGALKLDGGAVFGMIPRPVWETRMPPDASNRVTLGLNQLLVRGAGFVLLVDAGLGDKLTPRQRAYHGIETLASWEERLGPHGLGVSDITHLVITHLHYDHVGGATRFTEDGKECVPVFPNARVFVQAGEWNDAVRPNERTRSSYLLHGILPLHESGRLVLISGDIEPLPGIQLKVTGGHTAHHQMVLVNGGGSRLAWPADLCPTSCHLNATWQSAFDLFPLDSLRARQKFLDQTLNTKTLVIFNHDPVARLCRIVGDIDEPQAVDHA